MKVFKQYYFIPILFAALAASLLIQYLFPSEFYFAAFLTVLIPFLIVAFGFRIITNHRIQKIRNQLLQIFQTLEEFDVDEPTKVIFDESPYPIFNELNEYLVELIERIRNNYQANKQFTQNASHELQTPLAIIKGHIELLLQSPRIGEKEIQSLGVVLQNTNRLSKINSSLILLSKIEHQRFSDSTKVNMELIIEAILTNFKDLLDIQNIRVERVFTAPFIVEMSETLAEILVANLVQNAIRHNVEAGFIKIKINATCFSFENEGKTMDIKPENLFKRFKRDSDVSESLGLGLSIVKRICEQSGLLVKYSITDSRHVLTVFS